MSVDMSGPLGSMPADTTEAGAVPTGERPNKTPDFVTGVTDTRGFLAWLRTLCPSSLIVPGTADGFRATGSLCTSAGEKPLQTSLRASSGRSLRPWESVSRASCSTALGAAIRTPQAIDPPIHISWCRWLEAQTCRRCDPSPNSAA
jgi:hypothetical protein